MFNNHYSKAEITQIILKRLNAPNVTPNKILLGELVINAIDGIENKIGAWYANY